MKTADNKMQPGWLASQADMLAEDWIVVDYFNDHADKTDNKKITKDDVFIVWSCKTLQNNKALVSTTVSDGMYYEITHNGDKNETYVDAYKKWENFVVKGSEE